MSPALKRVHSATGTVALVIALIALIASAAGVGYAAGQIGTKDIANNAITAKKIKKNAVTTKKIKNNAVQGAKIKNGSLTAAELVPNESPKPVAFLNGGEGDCVWQSASAVLPGLATASVRKDRFGQVHLSGLVAGSNGAGGDGVCDGTQPGQIADAIAFVLPAGYIPAKSLVFASAGGDVVIVAGAAGLQTFAGVLPPGAVADNSGTVDAGGLQIVLDGVSFEAAGPGVPLAQMKASGRIKGSIVD